MNEFVTHQTRVMPVAPAPRRRSYTWLAVLAVASMSTVLGAGATFAAFDMGYLEAPAPESCLYAVELSDELNAMSEEYSVLVGRMLEAAFSFDEDAVAEVEADGEAFASRYAETLAAYEVASGDCRAEGGVR